MASTAVRQVVATFPRLIRECSRLESPCGYQRGRSIATGAVYALALLVGCTTVDVPSPTPENAVGQVPAVSAATATVVPPSATPDIIARVIETPTLKSLEPLPSSRPEPILVVTRDDARSLQVCYAVSRPGQPVITGCAPFGAPPPDWYTEHMRELGLR